MCKRNCCCVTLLVLLSIAATFLLLCTFMRVPLLNITFYTHAMPNTVHFLGYYFDGRPIEPPRTPGYYENGTKFADFESIIDRISQNNFTYVPPKQYLQIERETFDMTNLYKFDSVPPIFRDVALPRPSSLSRTSNIEYESGSSVFVTNLMDRGTYDGVANGMKYRYMAGLNQSYIDEYVELCRPRMELAIDCMLHGALPHDCIYDAVKDITFLVHTKQLPEEEDIAFIESGVDGFTSSSKISGILSSVFMPYEVQIHVLKHNGYIERLRENIQDGTYKGLFKSLKDNGYNEADIMVEYLHNILALTIQWTILMEELVDGSVQATDAAIYNHIKANPTAAFVISARSKDGTMPAASDEATHTLHNMKQIMQHHPNGVDMNNAVKCPHADKWKLTPERAVVAAGTQIVEEEGNWGFGRGERRCSCEVLTLEMMKAWIQVVQSHTFTYTRGKAMDTFGFGYKYHADVKV